MSLKNTKHVHTIIAKLFRMLKTPSTRAKFKFYLQYDIHFPVIYLPFLLYDDGNNNGIPCSFESPDKNAGASGQLFVDLFYSSLRSEVCALGCVFPSCSQWVTANLSTPGDSLD